MNNWKILSLHEGKVQHVFADEKGREREAQLVETKKILTKRGNKDSIITKYEPPINLWPIENFPEASMYYIDIINELIRNYRIPRIVTELKLITPSEQKARRIEIVSPYTLRNNLSLELVPSDNERIYKDLFDHEVYSGKAWLLVDIQSRNMTYEEKELTKNINLTTDLKRLTDKSVIRSKILNEHLKTYGEK